MAIKATSTGAIRPDFVEYSYLSQSTLEKRIRRYLAKQGQKLVKARPEHIPQFGLYAICGADRRITRTHINLQDIGNELGVLGEHERLDHAGLGWVWAVARLREERIDGKVVTSTELLSKEFATEAAAMRAAEDFADREGVAVIGFAPPEDRS